MSVKVVRPPLNDYIVHLEANQYIREINTKRSALSKKVLKLNLSTNLFCTPV